MKVVLFTPAMGGVAILYPREAARLATSVTLPDGKRLNAPAPVPVEAFLRGWPVEGAVATWAESLDEFTARIIAKDVPEDATNVVAVDEAQLQLPEDRDVRDAWELVNGVVAVNAQKALQIKRDRVDLAADGARRKYVPHLSTVSEYEQAERDASAFKAADYSGSVPAAVLAWAQAKGWTARQAADDILAAAASLRGKLMQIRAARLAGKEALGAGSKTLEQVLAELNAL